MIHPVLHLIATKPQLLADHLEAYAELLGEEVGKSTAVWKRRILLGVVGALLLIIGIVLGGVALMLWGVIPPGNVHSPWVLWAGPLAPFGVGVLCLLMSSSKAEGSAFRSVKQQLSADLRMLREVGTA